MRKLTVVVVLILVLLSIGCTAPKIRLFPSQADPLREFTLEGKAREKIVVIPIRGIITDAPREGLIRTRPSMVQEVVSQLRLAEDDDNVRAVLLKIDSPGGSVTGSDVLYKEILAYKQRTGNKVVVAMMGLAASGAYYISLPADYILAHPTTLTGSIGVIFIRPKVTDLMHKIGVDVEVNKSGKNKDMGSPFRPTSAEEEEILQELVQRLGIRFVDLVAKHRKLDPAIMTDISTARVYLANEAIELGLIDEIGYLDDAASHTKKLAGLPDNAKLVVYRRIEYPDDNVYNTATRFGSGNLSLISVDFLSAFGQFNTGFYYLWPSAAMDE